MSTTSMQVIGTISHGTLRNVDLIDAFSTCLYQLDTGRNCSNLFAEARRATKLLQVLDRNKQEPNARFDEVCHQIIEELFYRLDEYAPEGYYFGAHEGDGSDFGFWPYPYSDCEDEAEQENG